MEEIKKIAALLQQAKNCVVFTGAGISTESGIPDFRSSKTGLWEKVDPMEAMSTRALTNNPDLLYQVCFDLYETGERAQPNAAHHLLAKWEKQDLVKTIITQNIDHLHQRAGSQNVLEIHGTLQEGVCLACGQTINMDVLIEKVRKKAQMPALCNCGGLLKPAITLFGESLPEAFTIAERAAREADLLIVIGSSLVVSPANYLPSLATKLVIINRSATYLDKSAQVVIRDNAGSTLTAIEKAIAETSN